MDKYIGYILALDYSTKMKTTNIKHMYNHNSSNNPNVGEEKYIKFMYSNALTYKTFQNMQK